MALRDSTTSTGMRIVIVVLGRSLLSRFFTRSLIIKSLLDSRSTPSRNDSNEFAFDFDMHDCQKMASRAKADGLIACFRAFAGIREHQQRVVENGGRLEEFHAVLALVFPSFGVVPYESCPGVFKFDVHNTLTL